MSQMTRTEAIAIIAATLPALDDERLAVMAELARSWTGPTVYSTLSSEERAKIDAALDRLDQGQGISAATVFGRLAQKLKPSPE